MVIISCVSVCLFVLPLDLRDPELSIDRAGSESLELLRFCCKNIIIEKI